MTTGGHDVATLPPTHERPARRDWLGPRVRGTDAIQRIRVGLLVAWVVVCLLVPTLGTRSSSWGDLERGVAAGDVSSVEVVGGDLIGQGRGWTVVELRWRDGWSSYRASVRDVRSVGAQQLRRSTPAVHDVLGTLAGQGVSVTTSPYRSTTTSDLTGWTVPVALGLTTVFLWLTTALLLRHGPAPRRASRWAWFWLMLNAAPVGVPAFLLLEPWSRAATARPPARRPALRGWGGFFLSLLLGALVTGVVDRLY